jgi:MscS family membrane protein
MEAYLVACREGDYRRAAEYLDLRRLPRMEREAKGPELARELKAVLDRELWVDLDALSENPRGDLEDGLPRNRDAVGEIATQRGPVPILLERGTGPDGVRIWRIASSTVERIPELYAEFGYGPLEPWLPRWFFELSLLEIALWQWCALLALGIGAWALSWIAVLVLERGVRPLAQRTDSDLDDRLVNATAQPLRLGAAIALFHGGSLLLGLAVPVRRFLSELESALTIVAATWLLLRLVNLGTLAAARRLQQRDNATALGVVPIGQKAVKTFVVALAVIAMLDSFGFDVTALLAGLGVGGIAVALAAQKTLENLFGGITLLADRPVSVGDFCRFGDRVGTIESIGLRSTRVRTLDRTLVTVPNSAFSAMQLENYSARDRIWYHPILGLRYETTREQVRAILDAVREMLLAHPRVVPDPARPEGAVAAPEATADER